MYCFRADGYTDPNAYDKYSLKTKADAWLIWT